MKNTTIVVALAMFCCVISAVVADASRPLGDYVAGLHHTALPTDFSNLPGDFITNYIIGIATIVGPGLAIAILSLIVGIFYGLIRLCCCCCCSKTTDKDDEDYVPHQTYGFFKRMIPVFIYILFLCWILAGSGIGWSSNHKFSDGVLSLSSAVTDIGTSAVNLGDTLISALETIVSDIPNMLTDLLEQISGLPEIASRVEELGKNVNSTTLQVANIEDEVRAIKINLTIVQNLNEQLAKITSDSNAVIGNVTALTDQIGDKLSGVLNDTLTNINPRIHDIQNSVNDVRNQSDSFIDTAKDLVDTINGYVEIVQDYNEKRQQGLDAVYAVGLAFSCVGLFGVFFKISFPFHITAAFGFVFSFLFWAFGSVHLLLGIVLADTCPIIDPVLHSFLPTNGTGADVINGCLGNVTLFDSLGVTSQFNLTEVFDYSDQFSGFTDFINDFNFTEIDGYLGDISSLYSYNLTATADNLTVSAVGWDQQNVYDGLDVLNNETSIYGHVFSLQNYTQLDLNDYPSGSVRTHINDTKTVVDNLVLLNTTIYQQVDETKAQLYDIQADINVLVADIHTYNASYAKLHADIDTLATVNVTNALAIISHMKDKVFNFFTLGDCSFLGTNYRLILNSLCNTMEPAVDLLMGSCFMIGLGTIAVIILVEVLAVRMPHPSGDDDDNDKESYDYNSSSTPAPRPSGEQQSISLDVRTEAPSEHTRD